MSQAVRFQAQVELAEKVKVDGPRVRFPHYGRYLEEFVPGQVFVHPRGFTFLSAQMEAFARTYLQCNPLYLNDQYAAACGFAGLLARRAERLREGNGQPRLLRCPVFATSLCWRHRPFPDQGDRSQGAWCRQAWHRHHPYLGA